MEILRYLILILAGMFCYFAGYKVGCDINEHENYDGEFVINETDPNKDVISVGFYCDISEVVEKKELYFKVIHETEEMSSKNR